MTFSRSVFTRPRASMIVSSASSQATLRSEIDILPLTSSPITMLRPLSAARIRSRLTTSASLKSSEIRRWPSAGAGMTGAGGAAGAAGSAGAAGAGAGVAARGGAWATRTCGAGLATGLLTCAFGSVASARLSVDPVAVVEDGVSAGAFACGEVGITMARPPSSSRIA